LQAEEYQKEYRAPTPPDGSGQFMVSSAKRRHDIYSMDEELATAKYAISEKET
jgi:hypothetical protein